MSFAALSKDIEKKKFAPVYYLTGEEPYYIDKLVKLIEANALSKSEEAFNKAVLFGPDASFERLMSETKSFPMMAERRLVILKEANKFRDFEKLQTYFENPVPSTVFVIVWKGKPIDGRLKVTKALKAKATVFEGKKVYENECRNFAEEYARQKGFRFQAEALHLFISYLGTNLGLIESELDKIFLNLRAAGKTVVDTAIVYEMTNIDKDFNVFELMNSLGEKDHNRAHLIISKMAANQKEYPPVLTISQLFGFYNRLAMCAAKGLKEEREIAALLEMQPFVARQYKDALRRTNLNEIQRNLGFLLEADLQMKGIQSTQMGDEHIMKTLIYRLLN